MDDLNFFARTLEEALARGDGELRDMARLTFGWHIGLAKGFLHPARGVLYIGFELCSVPLCHVKVPSSKMQALAARLDMALSGAAPCIPWWPCYCKDHRRFAEHALCCVPCWPIYQSSVQMASHTPKGSQRLFAVKCH